jgi:hypothetical protein
LILPRTSFHPLAILPNFANFAANLVRWVPGSVSSYARTKRWGASFAGLESKSIGGRTVITRSSHLSLVSRQLHTSTSRSRNMFWDVRVVTAPSADTDLSLIVTFDQVRYFINCGEGTQRTCTQRGFGFKKLDAILLTSGSSDVAGGLPGMLMSAADSGVPALHIAGPENALQYLVSCRTFVQR